MVTVGFQPTRRPVLALLTVLLSPIAVSRAAEDTLITVYKDPNCGCCSGWVLHLQRNGFAVKTIETAHLNAVKKRLGVPDDLASCHTAEIGDYVIEGHVPASALKRLFAERPAASGLAVPGMPIGSPGMEGGAPEPYEVVIFSPHARKPFMRFIGEQPA